MRLDNFAERDQNKIVQLAMKRRTDVIEYKGSTVHLPNIVNALFICVNTQCNKTLDVTYFTSDVINNNVAQRITCVECGGIMNRKFIGVNITQVLNKHMKHVEDHSSKKDLAFWLTDIEEK